jgi:hypothetical protein
LGRVGFELGSGIVGGGIGLKVASKVPAVARALSGASRIQRAGATALANAPIDVVQGAQYDEGMLLPGRAGSIAENVGISGAAGALLPAVRPRPTPQQAVPDALDEIRIASGDRSLPKRERLLNPIERAYFELMDDTAPLMKLARAEDPKLAESLDGAIAVSAGSGQAGKQYIRENLMPLVREITETFGDNGMNRVAKAAVARRAYQSDLGLGISNQQRQDAYDLVMADPKLVDATDRLQDFFRDLLERRMKAGLITADDYDNIVKSDDYYTPFMADHYTLMTGGTSKSGGRWNVTDSGVKSIIRDPDFMRAYDITDPFEVAISQALTVERDIARAQVMQFIDQIADTPLGSQFIERVKYRPGIGNGVDKDVFQGIVGGERRAYRIKDPDLLRSTISQNALSDNIMLQILRKASDVQRFGVIAPPDFALMSGIRDMFAYGIQRPDMTRAARETAVGSTLGAVLGAATDDEDSNLASRVAAGAAFGAGAGALARPTAQILSAIGDIVGNRDIYKQWLREGGSTEGFYVKGPKDATKILELMKKDGVSMSDVVSLPRWADALMFIGSVAEQAPRLAKVKETLGAVPGQAGRDEWARAIQKGQDVSVRFARKGANKGVREIAAMTPFWNAGIQGWVKAFDIAKDPEAWVKAGAAITAPTLALWYVNKDNQEYWERPQWERDVFWLVPKEEGGFWRVPKPFQIGALFATLPEKLVTYLSRSGVDFFSSAAPEMESTLGGALASAAKVGLVDPAVQSFPIPTAIAAPLQQAFNTDFFTGRDIVPQAYQSLPREMQAMPRTSGFARALGTKYTSPLRIDKAVTDLTGTLGRRVSDVISDPIFRAAGMDAPVLRTQDQGVARGAARTLGSDRFITRDYDATENEYLARERIDRLEKIRNGLYQLARENADDESIKAYIDKNEKELQDYAALNEYRVALDKLTSARRDLMRNRAISPDDRDSALQEIKRVADEIAREALSYGIRR